MPTLKRLHFTCEPSTFELGSDGRERSTFMALRTGVVHDRGAEFTYEMLADYVRNFYLKVYNGAELQINLNHWRGTEAAGWIEEVKIEGNELFLTVRWTDLGVNMIKKELYKYISVEVMTECKHWQTGELIKNVLAGAALTNDPAIGGQNALMLNKILYYNPSNMEVFKIFLAELAASNTVDAQKKATLKSMFEQLTSEDQEEVKEEVEAIEAKPEKVEAEKEEAETEVEEEAEEDNSDVSTLAKIDARVAYLEKVNQAQAEQIRMTELGAKSKSLLFTNDSGKGFSNEKNLLSFMATLNKDQLSSFTALMSEYRTLDTKEYGASGADVTMESYADLKQKALELSHERKISFRQAFKIVSE